MTRTKMQIHRMQMRMKLPPKHDTRYAQYFSGAYSQPCQTSEMELFAKTVNDLKPLKTVIAKKGFKYLVYFLLVF